MRETAGLDAKIQFGDVGAELEKLALFSLLGFCGTIFATSPKLVKICDFCPAAPMLSQRAPNGLCVVGATGNFLGEIPAGARL